MITGKIGFCGKEEYKAQKQHLRDILKEGMQAAVDSYYDSPRWDSEPTDGDLIMEAKYKEDCIRCGERAEEIAKEIYLALTGKVL